MRNKVKSTPNFNEMSLDILVDFLEHSNHYSLRKLIVVITNQVKYLLYLEKSHPEIILISEQLLILVKLLEKYLNMEERFFFPSIKNLIQDSEKSLKQSDNLPSNLIVKVQNEHSKILQILSKIRKLTVNFVPSESSNPSLKLCYAQMFNLEQDIQKYLFIAQNILFPKLTVLEKRKNSLKSI